MIEVLFMIVLLFLLCLLGISFYLFSSSQPLHEVYFYAIKRRLEIANEFSMGETFFKDKNNG